MAEIGLLKRKLSRLKSSMYVAQHYIWFRWAWSPSKVPGKDYIYSILTNS